MNDEERRALRESLRQARRALSAEQHAAAANTLMALVKEEEFYKQAQHIAFYQPFDGEIDPNPLIQLSLKEGKQCYLPLMSEDETEMLSFAPFDADTELKQNKWGVVEPSVDVTLSTTDLDVVFVPLVGFDESCFRLGLGKGFYDRTFSFKIFNRRSQPMLVGLGHECQRTQPFPIASWDVRLDAVVTDEKIYRPETD